MPGADNITLGIYEKAFPATSTWAERLELTARAGFNFLEISIDESDQRLERLNWGKERRSELRALIHATGTSIMSMCLSAHRKYPMGSLSDRTRSQGLDLMEKAIDLALDLGARIVLVPGYDVFYEPSTDRTRQRFLEGLRQAVEWASCTGLMLALENTDRCLTSVNQTVWYVNEIQNPWLQLYCDIGNLHALEFDVLSEIRQGAGHIAGLHVKDTRPGEFRNVPFGEGTLPFVPIFQQLWETNFCGPIMLEIWDNPATDSYEMISEAREWVLARIEASRHAAPIAKDTGWQEGKPRNASTTP